MAEEMKIVEDALDVEKVNTKRYKKTSRRKVCSFCMDKCNCIDYKEVGKLRKYITEKGKIVPRRQTGTCAKHQRMLSNAVKKARESGLMAYVFEN